MKAAGPAQERERQRRALRRDLAILAAAAAATVVLLVLYPERRPLAVRTIRDYLAEMLQVLPAIVILMGLFAVWVTREQVTRHLGHASGLRGAVVALVLGALPTGPLYVAFPVARGLLDKGASTANVIIFLSAWACLKLPQEIMELRFLGLEFMLLRLGLTAGFVLLMGTLIGAVVRRQEGRPSRTPSMEEN